jgi:adenosylhomocysteine nucleosidase
MRRLVLLLALGLSAPLLRAERADVLLAAASDADLRPLLDRMAGAHVEKQAAWTFWLGSLGGKKVVLTRTEGDPLNAVAATTLAIRHYAPRLVVVFGTARAHDPSLRAGDVVVSEMFAAFDGMESPYRPVGGGSDSLGWTTLPHLLMTPGEKEVPAVTFAADAVALAAARSLRAPSGRVVVGVLGSAHQVNREADRIARLRAQWGTSCEDGESAHVAGCAQLLGVPVVGWREIDGAAGEAATLVVPFLEAWK